MKELIIALDVRNARRALEIAKATADYVDRIKVNYPLVLSAGVKIIRELSRVKPVVADFKIADVPHTSTAIAEIAFENLASAVIAHGFVGDDVIAAILDVAKSYGGEVYVVTELSSPGAARFMSRHSLEVAKLAAELGCHGLIAPATRVERVKEIRKVAERLKIFCPGIGAQGGTLEVLRYCDGVIVGRSIYGSEDPAKAAEDMRRRIDEISKGF